jgi:4-oxalocrotonate tautomerase
MSPNEEGSSLDLWFWIVRAQQPLFPKRSQFNCHLKEFTMPTIRVELLEGRTPEQKTKLVQALTQAVVDSLGSKPESVDVLLYDIERVHWATGGVQWSEKK